jgi:predicted nucleic acid-binding protein
MYLLDTNILSVLSPKPIQAPNERAVQAWIEATSSELFLSVISISEIELGIAKANRQGASRKAEALMQWLAGITHLYGGRLLSLDIEAARLTGRLLDRAYGRGWDPGYEDAAIAATAVARGFTVVTRNTRHFQTMDVPCLDPYVALPSARH